MAPPQLQGWTKKKKKRKKLSNSIKSNNIFHHVSQFANLTGSSALADQDDSIMMEMNMMMEMGTRQQSISKSQSKGSNEMCDSDEKTPSLTRLVSKLPSWLTEQRPGFMTDDDIKLWHQDFKRWADNGLYRQNLLPNIDQELARNFKVRELSTMLLKSGGGKGNDLRMPMFERWLIDSKFEEVSSTSTACCSGDPVLPSKASPYSDASKRLVTELINYSPSSSLSSTDGNTKSALALEEAQQKVAELCRSCNVACQELLSSVERYSKQSSLRRGDRIEIETKSDHQRGGNEAMAEQSNNIKKTNSVTILYARKKWKKPFCFRINADSLGRLRRRFYQVHSTSRSSNPNDTTEAALSLFHSKHKDLAERSFLVLVVSLLLRYSALSGGQLLDDLRGGGMQGAIHSTTFDVLQKHFSPSSSSDWLEGFASPFNATLKRFGSAFPLDLDWHFGSVGSFWGCSFAAAYGGENIGRKSLVTEEFCEANPPFSPGLMEGMVTHMIHRLQVAKTNGARLTFVVIVPTVKEQAISKSKKRKHDRKVTEGSSTVVQDAAASSFRAMVDGEFCTQRIHLGAREHGYVEGSQHLRPTQYKQSTYDTSVIILQSPEATAARKKLFDEGSLEREIRTAFASRHESELKERRVK